MMIPKQLPTHKSKEDGAKLDALKCGNAMGLNMQILAYRFPTPISRTFDGHRSLAVVDKICRLLSVEFCPTPNSRVDA
jgi:hypothetical protein